MYQLSTFYCTRHLNGMQLKRNEVVVLHLVDVSCFGIMGRETGV